MNLIKIVWKMKWQYFLKELRGFLLLSYHSRSISFTSENLGFLSFGIDIMITNITKAGFSDKILFKIMILLTSFIEFKGTWDNKEHLQTDCVGSSHNGKDI